MWASIRLTKDPSVARLSEVVAKTRSGLAQAAIALLIILGAITAWTAYVRPPAE